MTTGNRSVFVRYQSSNKIRRHEWKVRAPGNPACLVCTSFLDIPPFHTLSCTWNCCLASGDTPPDWDGRPTTADLVFLFPLYWSNHLTTGQLCCIVERQWCTFPPIGKMEKKKEFWWLIYVPLTYTLTCSLLGLIIIIITITAIMHLNQWNFICEDGNNNNYFNVNDLCRSAKVINIKICEICRAAKIINIKIAMTMAIIIIIVIIWLAPRAGSKRRILCSDWLPERARWLGIDLVLFLRFYGPQLRLGP